MSESNLSKNIFLQAKRASKLLDCSLTKAKNFIAQAIYQCHDYDDLCNKLESNSLKSIVYPFCHLNPHSSKNSINYLKNNVEFLCERFQNFVHKPSSPIPLTNLIWSIFGLSPQKTQLQILPEIFASEWQPSSDLKEPARGIFEYKIKINGVHFKLLAVRIVVTDMFIDNTLREHVQLRDEFSKFRFAPIYWKPWINWQDEADVFFNSIGSSPAPIGTSFNRSADPDSPAKQALQDIVFEALSAIDDEFGCSKIKKSDFNGEAFYFLGFSTNGTEEKVETLYVSENHIINQKCIIKIRDAIVIAELFEVNDSGEYVGDSHEYYGRISNVLQKFLNASRNIVVIAGKKYEIYIRSCTELEFERYCNSHVSVLSD
ncbi:hypothetical protein [Rheinheimera sp. KL1]|uniref:hypothetical protein n=1 Tax=Rheinheimera sp. KL1 TaxID=1635005 RepID=UPI000AE457EC|nr:hypothetical protein [Rheinheimera sp. KL1]